jgi:hypothetical protein
MKIRSIALGAFLIGISGVASAIEKSAAEATTNMVEVTKTGSYTSGSWTYRYIVLEDGPHKGYVQGFLMYRDKELLDPKGANAFISTPWGWLQWTPRPQSARGNWLPVKVKPAEGRELPDPATHPEIISNPPPTPARP